MAGLDQILENRQIKEYFQNAIASNRISHCYVIGGADGMGKMTLARAVAQTLQCTAQENRPCGTCSSCIRFESDNHPDVIYPKHEKPTVFGVDDVREGIVNDILIKPFDSQYKIYIIDEGEKLSAQAQNAMLKTIEEPPAYGILMILTSNPQGLLETIRSRSVVLSMSPVSDDCLITYLEEHGIDHDRALTVARFAQGNIGKAMKLASADSFSTMIGRIMDLLKRADTFSFGEMLDCITALEEYKLQMSDILSFIRMWYADALMLKATGDPNLLVFSDEYSYLRKTAEHCSYNSISHVLEEIDAAERRIDANVNFQLCIELLWIAIIEASR